MEQPCGVAAQFRRTDVSDVKEVRECYFSLTGNGIKVVLQERERERDVTPVFVSFVGFQDV